MEHSNQIEQGPGSAQELPPVDSVDGGISGSRVKDPVESSRQTAEIGAGVPNGTSLEDDGLEDEEDWDAAVPGGAVIEDDEDSDDNDNASRELEGEQEEGGFGGDVERELANPEPEKKRHRQEKPKKKKSIFVDDAAEDSDEDQGKTKRSRFIDDIAEVEDDDDDDDEDDSGLEDLIDDDGDQPTEVDLAEVRRAMREVQANKDDEIDPEALKKFISERYTKERAAAYASTDVDYGNLVQQTAVLQQALMPKATDPKLWVIRCADGAERDIVVRLTQKCYDYASKGTPLLIKSAFCKDGLKGFIYVEARSEAHVLKALTGLRSVYLSKKPKQVPLDEMITAITISNKNASASAGMVPGAWVRMKSGVYKGDLARVDFVDINEGRASVRLVPRLDLAGMAAKKASKRSGNNQAQKRASSNQRPLPKPFIPEEARVYNLDVIQQRDRLTGQMVYVLNNSQSFSQGYLIKRVALKTVSPVTSAPPLDELQRFDAASQGDRNGEDVTELLKGFDIESGTTTYAARDKVEVKEGELQGVRGTVVRVTDDGGHILVRLDDSALAGIEPISFTSKELRKYVEVGAHVKVINGSHKGQTGMVVSVSDDATVCHVVTDATREDIRVFVRDTTEAVAVATTIDSIGDYELFDLVVLDAQTVGVIIGVDKDSCKVLTNQGRPDSPDVRICRLPDIKRKVVNRRASAVDGTRNEVNLGDIVEMFEGPLRGKSGTVKHIMRGALFLQSRDVLEHGGFVCVQARQAKVRGGKRLAAPGGGVLATPARNLATPNPHGGSGGVLASPSQLQMVGNGHMGRNAPGGGGYTGRLSTQHDKLLEGRKVDIKKGPYRGMRGTIKSATGSHVRVELEARMQTVTVSRAHLSTQDGGIASQRPRQTMGMGMGMGGMGAPGGATPGHWSSGVMATPAHYGAMGSETPMYHMTPGREATSTPAYDPAWASTPAHPGFGPGSLGVDLGAPADQKGPAPSCRASEWAGLFVTLQDGTTGKVVSVTDDGAVEVDRDGGAIRTGVDQLELAPIAAGDNVRILVGNNKDSVGVVTYLSEKGEIFVQTPGEEQMNLLQSGECGKC
jgi:transcription elongation factor SPT5